MYDYIKGKIISKNFPKVVIENNNIGYSITCNQRTILALPNKGEDAKIYTKLIHKEDSMYFCGFSKIEDRIIFDILTTVSGIGVKVAMVLLDEFAGSELIGAVISGDYKMISRAKGVGPKLAQKIILELKDKLASNATTLDIIASNTIEENSKISKETIAEVQTILQSLGWSNNEYSNAIKTALNIVSKDDGEELLKETLRILSND
ncbi:MAG: Holliday junction branch migration protein RuvA [Cyanobacteria bacterium SIG30]|nr:Holliday junction branch migration protein RuvA [Cyanobacteria bacterium SIG30]